MPLALRMLHVQARARLDARLRQGLAIAALHALLGVLVQVEEYFQFVRAPGEELRRTLAFLARLPFRQLEWVGVALVVGAAWVFWPRGAWARRLYLGVATLVNLYVALDPIAYRFFFDHLRPSSYEGALHSVGALAGSVRAAIDAVVVVNVVLGVLATLAIALVTARPGSDRGRARLSPAALAVGAVYVVLSVAFGHARSEDNLDRHPLVTLALDAFRARHGDTRPGTDARALYTPRRGPTAESADDSRALARAVDLLRRGRRAPNIVLVIFESVGARQLEPLLDAPSSEPNALPNLRALGEHSVLFDDVYDLSPTTMRTHLPLNTGGASVTSSALFDVLGDRYVGPSLASELRRAGYRTALFSAGDLDLEGLGRFYAGLGYDELFDFGAAPPAFRSAHQVNSWGGDEDAVRERAVAWIDAGPRDRPFFLQFLTITTHHPYDVPAGYRGSARSADSLEAKYTGAFGYADAVIGRLVQDLGARGLLEGTLLVLTGDHGEAFGRLHPGVVGHKDLYDEDVRTFLWVIDPSTARTPRAPGDGGADVRGGLRSHRIGTVGDLMPTVLSLAGLPPADISGQDLTSDRYAPRIAYFYKNGFPGAWGLRDGAWKYVARFEGERRPELYDLASDPDETRNVATAHPDLVELYDRLCASWYAAKNAELVERQRGGQGEMEAATRGAREALAPVVATLAIGVEGESGLFVAEDAINPWDKIVARTDWETSPTRDGVAFTWTSPSGATFRSPAKMRVGRSSMPLQDPLPHEPGSWRLSIADGAREIASRAFQVDPAAKLSVPLEERRPTLALQVESAAGALAVVAHETRRRDPFKIWCAWTSPSGKETWTRDIYPGATEWRGCAAAATGEHGGWRVRILAADRETELGAGRFEVP